MSDFSALSVGLSGVEAARAALDVIGQNVSNANTPGYSRQRIQVVGVGGVQYPGFDQGVPPMAGSGVQVTGILRITDGYLAARSLTEHGNSGALTARQTGLAAIQQTFPEPGTGGIQETMSNYWNSWSSLANNPGGTSARSLVLTQGVALASSFNQASASLSDLSSSTAAQLGGAGATLNGLSAQVARLNDSVRQGTGAHLPVNELSDQRDQLISQMSDQIGVNTHANADGTVDVFAGAQAIVRGDSAQTLTLTGTTLRIADGSTVTPSGGQIGGLVTTLGDIANYQGQLDTVANTLKDGVNAQQALGVDQTGASGQPFFSGTGAGSLTVAISDPAGLAAAASTSPVPINPVTGLPDPIKNLDGSNAHAMAELAAQAGSPDKAYSRFITTLGSSVQQVSTQLTNQAQVTTSVDAANQAASGVNIDEELSNMLMYQHAYEASAKFISAVDTTLQTLISLIR